MSLGLDDELHLVFIQGGEKYAVGLGGVNEVIEPVPFGFVPQAPPVCLGVLAHHGHALAVIDGAGLLGGASRGGSPVGPLTRLVILSYGEYRFALRVDRIDRIGPMTAGLQPALRGEGTSEGRWLEGVFPEPDGVINKVNTEALVEEIDRYFQAA